MSLHSVGFDVSSNLVTKNSWLFQYLVLKTTAPQLRYIYIFSENTTIDQYQHSRVNWWIMFSRLTVVDVSSTAWRGSSRHDSHWCIGIDDRSVFFKPNGLRDFWRRLCDVEQNSTEMVYYYQIIISANGTMRANFRRYDCYAIIII